MKQPQTETLILEKFVNGGQAMGTLANGKKVLVWGGLPTETVDVEVYKNKKNVAEGIVTKVIKKSPVRIEPKELETYLSTSPWQIINFEAENKHKKAILIETFQREGLPIKDVGYKYTDKPYGYRNKMEFGFWGDEKGINIAHFKRGSHGKIAVTGSALAKPQINNAAREIIEVISKLDVRAGDLKALIIRTNQASEVAVALFVKLKKFPKITLPPSCKGIAIYYSDPKSPASVVTKNIYTLGDITLMDNFGADIIYDVNSFFQVNPPVFELALNDIKNELNKVKMPIIDMYSGVGTIGLSLGKEKVTLIESDNLNMKYLIKNAKNTKARVIHELSEKALDLISSDMCLIVDPPRAGLHKKLTDRILEAKPKKVVYLSCNPITQARDVKIMTDGGYKLKKIAGYNFFPRTPHLESLAVLDYK